MVQTEETQHIRRITSIQFTRMQDLVNFMLEHGVAIRKIDHNIIYKVDGQTIYWDETRRILEKYGIPVEKEYRWTTEVKTYDCQAAIQEKFDMTAEIKVHNYSVEVSTHNTTKFEQKKEVRKLYIPLKKAGIAVNYNCETEITSDSCKQLRG